MFCVIKTKVISFFFQTQTTISGQTQTQRPSRSSSMSSGSTQAPTTRPPTPPLSRTLGRPPNIGGHYRTPAPPVAPPSVPHTNYAMSQVGMGQRSSGYSQYGANAPVIGISRPISQSTGPPPSPIIREGSMIHQGSIGNSSLLHSKCHSNCLSDNGFAFYIYHILLFRSQFFSTKCLGLCDMILD